MLDRQVGFPAPQPEPAAAEPPEGETRVKLPGAVDQCDGGVEVFAKIRERVGGATKDIGIVSRNPKCPPGEIDAFAAVRRRVVCRTGDVEHLVVMRRQGKSRTIARIALNRLPEQFQRTLDPDSAPSVVRE